MDDGYRLGELGEVGACPAHEGVACAGRIDKRESRCRNVVSGGVGRGHTATVEVVGDVVVGGGPVGRVAAVAYGALDDGYRRGGLGEIGARPASEGVALLGWVVQREGRCCNVVGGGVSCGHTAAVKVIGDVVGDGGEGGSHRGIVVGGHGEGVAAEGGAVEAVCHLIACGVIVAQGDGGVAGVVGGALIGDTLARGGDVLAEGEGVHAACAVYVVGGATVTYAHIGGVGRAAQVDDAVAVVVGGEGGASVVAPDEGTHVGVAASDVRTDDETVLYRSSNIIAHESADVLVTRKAGIGKDDVLDGGAGNSAEKCHVFVRVGVSGWGFVNADAVDGMVLAVVGAAKVLVAARAIDDEIAADLGEVVFGAAAAVGVSDVGGLFEGEALAIVGGKVHQGGEVVEVVLVGNFVGVVTEAGEVAEGHVTNVEIARDGAGVFSRPRDGEGGGAYTVIVGVTHRVVIDFSEYPATVGDGGHRLNGTALVDISRIDAADGGVGGVERLEGHKVEKDVAEGPARRNGNGDVSVVAAGCNGAARDASAVQFLYRGAVEPEVVGREYNRDLAACGNVGETVGRGEVDRACDGDAAPIEIDVLAIEGAAIALRPWLGKISHKAIDAPYVIGYAANVAALSREGHEFSDGGESLLPREDGYYGEQRGEEVFEV